MTKFNNTDLLDILKNKTELFELVDVREVYLDSKKKVVFMDKNTDKYYQFYCIINRLLSSSNFTDVVEVIPTIQTDHTFKNGVCVEYIKTMVYQEIEQ